MSTSSPIVDHVETLSFRLPMRGVLRWGKSSALNEVRHVLVRVFLRDGSSGVAEAPPRPTIYGETVASIRAVIEEELAPRIVGTTVAAAAARLDEIPNNHTAKGALDMAIHDALAQSRPGTEAAEMVDRYVDAAVVGERFERLRLVIERSGRAKHLARIGRVEEVAVDERAVEGHGQLPIERSKLTVLPVLSRDEFYSEYERSSQWREIAAREREGRHAPEQVETQGELGIGRGLTVHHFAVRVSGIAPDRQPVEAAHGRGQQARVLELGRAVDADHGLHVQVVDAVAVEKGRAGALQLVDDQPAEHLGVAQHGRARHRHRRGAAHHGRGRVDHGNAVLGAEEQLLRGLHAVLERRGRLGVEEQ